MSFIDRIIREDECRHITGLSRTTRWRKECNGSFPKRIQISANSVGWMLSEVMEWLKNCRTDQSKVRDKSFGQSLIKITPQPSANIGAENSQSPIH